MRRIAILIIHGFGGGIYDQEDLANSLELINKFSSSSSLLMSFFIIFSISVAFILVLAFNLFAC